MRCPMWTVLWWWACAPDPVATGPLDARVEVPEAAPGTARFRSTEAIVPPGEERQFCTFFTWDQPEVGITATRSFQHALYGHHAVLLTTIVSDYQQPDGSSMDCTSAQGLSMAQTEALYVPTPIAPGSTGMTLPDGMAVSLTQGTRLVLQSHYVNWSDQEILVSDVVDLDTIPADDVQTWAAAFAHTAIDLSLPPGESTVAVDCTWEDEVTLLYLLGHMHGLGSAFSVDFHHDDTVERIYDVPTWYASYRDAPPITELAAGEVTVRPGDRFVTTCAWDNDTDEIVRFPAEMCAAVGIAYPSRDALYCAEL